jgi:hypothetical protein
MTPNASGRQTYRSFSYDPAPQPTIRTAIPDQLKWRADRKLLRNY